MKLPIYLALLHRSEQSLAGAFRVVADGHAAEPDVYSVCQLLAGQCDEHVRALQPAVQRYGEADEGDEPENLHHSGPSRTRSGPVGLLRDLQDLYVLASLVDVTWTMIKQAALGLRDIELRSTVEDCEGQTSMQLDWLRTRMSQAAPQALIAAR
ncbi:MAG: hypothetical protein JWN61_1356 [Pseudonocardiales bacterium]|nr:hypothetical protein [Jatrophihabitantaceae bacterium]MCW2603221.1 hypothetical protein [Pseudonocardiales bacterium]